MQSRECAEWERVKAIAKQDNEDSTRDGLGVALLIALSFFTLLGFIAGWMGRALLWLE